MCVFVRREAKTENGSGNERERETSNEEKRWVLEEWEQDEARIMCLGK